jgi:hypothetical protein
LEAVHPQSDCLRNLVSARIQVCKSIPRLFSVRCTTYCTASLSRSEGQICPIQPALSVFICSLLCFFLVWRRFTRPCAIFSVSSGVSVWRLHSGSQLVMISFCMACKHQMNWSPPEHIQFLSNTLIGATTIRYATILQTSPSLQHVVNRHGADRLWGSCHPKDCTQDNYFYSPPNND